MNIVLVSSVQSCKHYSEQQLLSLTICLLMNLFIRCDTMNLSRSNRIEFPSVPEIFFVIANSADPDETPQSVKFHQDLYSLPKVKAVNLSNVFSHFLIQSGNQ